MSVPRVLLRLPTHVLNGIGVATGIAVIQLLVGSMFGVVPAVIAAGGGVLSSLADVPVAPDRTWRRVSTAAVISCLATVAVSALLPWPNLLGLFTFVLAFASSLALAWGPRAGPISFVGVLALVFTMAAEPETGWRPLLAHAGWTALGATLYVGWARALSTLLQPRYRTLALADSLQALAGLLRSRVGLLTGGDDVLAAAGTPPLQAWIERQVALDERLQAARDLLFPAEKTERVRHRVAALLSAIDLRDTLMASELDLDLLGRDAAAERVRAGLAANMEQIADQLDAMAEALRLAHPIETPEDAGSALREVREAALFPPTEPRARLVTMLTSRAHHMVDELEHIRAALQGADVPLPLDRDALMRFVSPEGWPLAALRSHLRMGSPVMRHALRFGIALGAAYFIAEALPWGSHPHWLVLSVAVVLRGNLEQTLARRNGRVIGTFIGCLVVMAIATFNVVSFSNVIYLFAVGTAHAFVLRRYMIAATGATVMALLQAHLAHPEHGFPVSERLADTVIGALLAWGFAYLLPYWERRNMGALVDRVLKGLDKLATEALRWPGGSHPELALRLARREVYDAIGAIAASAQRTGAEPASVQVPLHALASLLSQCHMMLAQLSALRSAVMRRSGELERAEMEPEMQRTAGDVHGLLALDAPGAAELTPMVDTDAALPAAAGPNALAPWIVRRLRVTTIAAARVAQAARALRAASKRR